MNQWYKRSVGLQQEKLRSEKNTKFELVRYESEGH